MTTRDAPDGVLSDAPRERGSGGRRPRAHPGAFPRRRRGGRVAPSRSHVARGVHVAHEPHALRVVPREPQRGRRRHRGARLLRLARRCPRDSRHRRRVPPQRGRATRRGRRGRRPTPPCCGCNWASKKRSLRRPRALRAWTSSRTGASRWSTRGFATRSWRPRSPDKATPHSRSTCDGAPFGCQDACMDLPLDYRRIDLRRERSADFFAIDAWAFALPDAEVLAATHRRDGRLVAQPRRRVVGIDESDVAEPGQGELAAVHSAYPYAMRVPGGTVADLGPHVGGCAPRPPPARAPYLDDRRPLLPLARARGSRQHPLCRGDSDLPALWLRPRVPDVQAHAPSRRGVPRGRGLRRPAPPARGCRPRHAPPAVRAVLARDSAPAPCRRSGDATARQPASSTPSRPATATNAGGSRSSRTTLALPPSRSSNASSAWTRRRPERNGRVHHGLGRGHRRRRAPAVVGACRPRPHDRR